MSKAIVVFSGGQDSTTCLFWALEKYDEVHALTFTYGQRHSLEVEVAKNIADELSVPQKIVDVSVINEFSTNALTDSSIPIETDEEMPNTFVPGRNVLFFTLASIMAKVINADAVIVGISQADFSGYPDCTEPFRESLNQTVNIGMDQDVEIIAPLMNLDKSEVWELSDQLGAFEFVKENTLTCYNGIMAEGCGSCPACILRNEGLKKYEEKIK